jgi:hypothetical protein
MEDAHVHILSLGPGDPPAAYFAVFDGHGGARTAAYCANNLHRCLSCVSCLRLPGSSLDGQSTGRGRWRKP